MHKYKYKGMKNNSFKTVDSSADSSLLFRLLTLLFACFNLIVTQNLLLRVLAIRVCLDGQIQITGCPFRDTGWPIGHPVNILGEALS